MPAEFRQIIFSSIQVLVAIRDHRRRTRTPLPAGSIVRFEISREPAIQADLEIATGRSLAAFQRCTRDGEKME